MLRLCRASEIYQAHLTDEPPLRYNFPKLRAIVREMKRWIYNAYSDGSGGAYLGDGVWISSEGSLSDRGR